VVARDGIEPPTPAFSGLPQWIALSTGRLAHYIMQRRQLPGIARRAEG